MHAGRSACLAWIDVELPGRGRLRAEPLQTRMADLIPLLRRELTVDYHRPFALFGHSLGALIAFEFAYRLEREIGVSPAAVFASAAHAPSSQERRRDVHRCPMTSSLRSSSVSTERLPRSWLALSSSN